MENDVIVFIYKREPIDDNLKKENREKKLFQYILEPVEIIEGILKEENGQKCFYSSDGEFYLKSIEDTNALDEEYLYAFPIIVDEYGEIDREETKDYMKKEDLFNTFLMQRLSQKEENVEELKTFAYNSYSKKVIVLIDADNYDISERVIEYDITERAKKIDGNNLLLIKYSDIETLEKQKKEEESKEKKQEKVKHSDRYEDNPHKAVKYNKNIIYADELYDEITRYVLRQDEQIKTIATLFAKNQRIDNPYLKGNFILCGPTGVGKSEIFRRLSSIAEVPMISEDSSEFTAEGYVGKSLTSILTHLYDAAEGDLKAAENGIIMLDEIDKKAGARGNVNMEVGKAAVIDALLKMIEGHTYEINVGRRSIYFDTSRVTFTFCGAFSGIEDYVDDKPSDNKRKIGFHSTNAKEEKIIPPERLYTYETLHKYGMLPEFLGRNRIIAMNSLTQEDLEKILRESELSYLKLYKEHLKNNHIEFIYDDDVIKAIAEKAIKIGSGARSLKSIAEDALTEIDFLVGSKDIENYDKIIITKDTIEDPKKFILR